MPSGYYESRPQGIAMRSRETSLIEAQLPRGNYIVVAKTVLRSRANQGGYYSVVLQLGNQADGVELYTSQRYEADVITLTLGASLSARSRVRLTGVSFYSEAFSASRTALSVVEVDSLNSRLLTATDIEQWSEALVVVAGGSSLPKKAMEARNQFLAKVTKRIGSERRVKKKSS
jgi:hypothetical protein